MDDLERQFKKGFSDNKTYWEQIPRKGCKLNFSDTL